MKKIDLDFVLNNKIDLSVVIRGVYFLINNSEVLYIGSSGDCNKRIRQHKLANRFRFNAYYIHSIPKEKKDFGSDLEKFELRCIHDFKPRYNLIGNPDFHSGSKAIWFAFVSSRLTIKEISQKTGVNFAITSRIIKCKRKTKDDKYTMVKDSVSDYFYKKEDMKKTLKPLFLRT